MKRDALLMVGAGLVGGGIALLGARLMAAASSPEPAPPSIFAIWTPPAPPPPAPRFRLERDYPAPTQDQALERARRARVAAYRVRLGELAMGRVDDDIQDEVAALLEGIRPLPCGAADGAIPLDW